MKIVGGPEELASFIRALNDEPVYLLEEPAKIQTVPRRPAKPVSDPAIFLTCAALAFICLIIYTIFQGA